jgi:hypothetical protein
MKEEEEEEEEEEETQQERRSNCHIDYVRFMPCELKSSSTLVVASFGVVADRSCILQSMMCTHGEHQLDMGQGPANSSHRHRLRCPNILFLNLLWTINLTGQSQAHLQCMKYT